MRVTGIDGGELKEDSQPLEGRKRGCCLNLGVSGVSIPTVRLGIPT